MLRVEMYPCMTGVHVRVAGFELPSQPAATKDLGQSVERIVSAEQIAELGLAGALAKFLWDVHSDYPALVNYARR